MGLISQFMNLFFGNSRNAVVEVAEVFRENAEGAGLRAAQVKAQSMAQFAAEFQHRQRGWFDRFMDGVNRVPRPALALGTLGLFVAAMFDPAWFAARMVGLATVPEPLWWLLGVIVSFYFGARYQAKGQDFQRAIAQGLLQSLGPQALGPQEAKPAGDFTDNAALRDWRAGEN